MKSQQEKNGFSGIALLQRLKLHPLYMNCTNWKLKNWAYFTWTEDEKLDEVYAANAEEEYTGQSLYEELGAESYLEEL